MERDEREDGGGERGICGVDCGVCVGDADGGIRGDVLDGAVRGGCSGGRCSGGGKRAER